MLTRRRFLASVVLAAGGAAGYAADVRRGFFRTLARPSTRSEILWPNVCAADGVSQKYCFAPGETAVFAPSIRRGKADIHDTQVRLILKDAVGAVRLDVPLQGGPTHDDATTYRYDYSIPPDAPTGPWLAEISAVDADGATRRQSMLLAVRPATFAPAQRMLIGAMVDDYGFSRYHGKALDALIAEYRSCAGLQLWKVAVAWSRLEPRRGNFHPEVIAGLRKFIAAAHAAGAAAQVAIQQQNFPAWANDGHWDDRHRYQLAPTLRLADTWRRLALGLKDCPGLDSYLPINEEDFVYDADIYLRSMSRVVTAIRLADSNLAHRITLRPNTRDPYLRTRISSGGNHDFDYGTGGYPTSWAWSLNHYADPVSATSFLRMARFHESPLVFGKPGGVGEIGFCGPRPGDGFTDDQKLAGFERAMIIAYEMGLEEFMLWGGGFGFKNLPVYYAKLVAFRDRLVRRPRPAAFDVRLVLDTGDYLYLRQPPANKSSALDLAVQPFLPALRYLDSRGYVWFYTTPRAMRIQDRGAQVTLRLSELKGRPAAAQLSLLNQRLQGVAPSASPLPWP